LFQKQAKNLLLRAKPAVNHMGGVRQNLEKLNKIKRRQCSSEAVKSYIPLFPILPMYAV
jgi:hypothetical protein